MSEVGVGAFVVRQHAVEVGGGFGRAGGYQEGELCLGHGLQRGRRLEFVFMSSIGEAIRLTFLIDRAVRDDQHKDDPT